jgi:copper chaperone CopZ
MRILALIIVLVAAGAANAETITASVNGMVCAICVTGIEKSFQKNPAVEKVKVDLEAGKVTVDTKAGATLDDAAVTKTIMNAGYAVTEITRQGR